jgi:hypothetical protein
MPHLKFEWEHWKLTLQINIHYCFRFLYKKTEANNEKLTTLNINYKLERNQLQMSKKQNSDL